MEKYSHQDHDILVFIPTYNEYGNIEKLCAAIKKNISCTILFCDDNSPDGTGQLLDTLAAQDPTIKVMHRPKKMGLGTAHLAAFWYAKKHAYKVVITMDADFTHDPVYLPALIAKRNDADIIIGSRYESGGKMSGWNKIRLPFTLFWKNAIKYGLGMPYDCTTAFRLYNVNIMQDELISTFSSTGFSFNIESLYKFKKHGARIAQIPIHAQTRQYGESKLSVGIMTEMAKEYFKILIDRLFGKKPTFLFHER